MKTPFDAQVVLVTGGTGSFGNAFVRYLLEHPVRKVIVYSRDEYKQWAMRRELSDNRLRFFLGDIRDVRRLTHACQRADVLVHAAALKHVTALEYNPQEAQRTNVQGTENVIQACIDSPIQKAVFLSSDKAVAPLNLYGATKMMGEKLWLASNVHKNCFSFVRYGNVMESRGGVLGIWKDAISQGKPLRLTDPSMTRFWMTFPMAIEAVRHAAALPAGLAVIHKAPAFILGDLASVFVDALRYDAMGDIVETQIETIGVAPGEKMHETLVSEAESVRCIDVGDKYILVPERSYDDKILYEIKGEMVPKGFWYSSDAAPKLTVEQMWGMV